MNPFRRLKLAFTTFRIDPDSALVLENRGAPAGYVARIRLWNFLEPSIEFGLIMAVIWISRMDTGVWWVRPSFGAILLWMLLISPIVHYRFEKDLFLTEEQKRRGVWFYLFESRGLGSPLRYYLPILGERPQIFSHWKTILGCVAFIDLLFISACITFHPEIIERFPEQMGGSLVWQFFFQAKILLGIDLALVLVAFPFMLRLDNFHESIGFMGAFMILIGLMALFGNLGFQLSEDHLREALESNPYMRLRGASASERLHSLGLFAVGGQWSGYVFWGWLQQLLFLGVFSTHYCRAFDIGRSRWHVLAACLCSAALFGLVHIPNFWLSVVTFIGGFCGALFAMQCRNLFALGVVHGFGGTMMNKLLPINFTVGPK